MEPTEPKTLEPFPGYNEMPEQYKGELSVTIYQDSETGVYEARFIEMRREGLMKEIEERNQMERSLQLNAVTRFDRVSFVFLTAAVLFARNIPKNVRLRSGDISWQLVTSAEEK